MPKKFSLFDLNVKGFCSIQTKSIKFYSYYLEFNRKLNHKQTKFYVKSTEYTLCTKNQKASKKCHKKIWI